MAKPGDTVTRKGFYGAGTSETWRRLRVASAMRFSVFVIGNAAPLSHRATADCELSIFSANSAWDSLARRRASVIVLHPASPGTSSTARKPPSGERSSASAPR